jgi:hypothetical protein
MSLDPSPVRLALDELLRRYFFFDLVDVDWQLGAVEKPLGGPWCVVRLGQRSEDFARSEAWAVHTFAIWKSTGALHSMNGGAVSDDPIWTP